MKSNAQRRLLDLIAGWQQYVSKCAESTDPHPGVTQAEYEAEAEALHDLYQSVGRIEDMHEMDVSLLVMGTITKLVTQGPRVETPEPKEGSNG